MSLTKAKETYPEGIDIVLGNDSLVKVAVIDHSDAIDAVTMVREYESTTDEEKKELDQFDSEGHFSFPMQYHMYRDLIDKFRKPTRSLQRLMSHMGVNRQSIPIEYWYCYLRGVDTLFEDPWAANLVYDEESVPTLRSDSFEWPRFQRALEADLVSEGGKDDTDEQQSKVYEAPVEPEAQFPDEDEEFWRLFAGRHELYGAGKAAEMAMNWLRNKEPKFRKRAMFACITFTEKPARFVITGKVGTQGAEKDHADDKLAHYLPMLTEDEFANLSDREGFFRRRGNWGVFERINLSRIRIIAYACMQLNWNNSHKVFQQLRKHYEAAPLSWTAENGAFRRMLEATRNIKLQGIDIFRQNWRVIEAASDKRSVFGL